MVDRHSPYLHNYQIIPHFLVRKGQRSITGWCNNFLKAQSQDVNLAMSFTTKSGQPLTL